ncbi:sulfotransferase family protein [Salegentibacter mishustinae]|uniref:Sulfotransferase n=1 Tax=Salegentibacter mishustinae TaxID=270918 RepID=A0A0Q9ZHL2_9FLAO|nr:sulfotransferase [Salegentibacter mishustinae]KRG29162.1 hypothetical protein APR42_04320 [Salegentibacter mishustinae]PNW21786.1 hypothetical protein APB85_11165 [Salegentibacter mishustinae]PZX65129.1 sulfotransferase family protein [Salegentibacter mishustinae]GGW87146.1 hypothetical protein GCM10008086_14530 [Salegentibacter mishustinae]
MEDSPIFLLGNHKSGTSLLRSIFDGLDDYAVLPIETHPFQILQYGIRYPYRKQASYQIDFNVGADNAINWIKSSNNKKDKYSDSLTYKMFDETFFNKKMKKDTYPHIKAFIDNYLIAIYNAYKAYPPFKIGQRFVEKSVENLEFALDLQKIYPNAIFIHIIRNPYSNLVSLRKYKTIKGYPRLHKPIMALNDSYYYLYRNERLIENYKIIQYEDLITNPKQIILDICKSFNLEYKNEMLVPTVDNGKKWGGNSTSDIEFSGITNKKINEWKKQISPSEIALINKLFPHILERFDYDKLKTGKVYNRNPHESLKTYLFNRFLLKYGKEIFQ